MPLNHTQAERRLSECDAELNALFADPILSDALKKHIKAVQGYYNTSYIKAKKNKTVEDIIATYKSYIEQLTKIKSGTLAREKMLGVINDNYNSRIVEVIWANLTKAAQLIFWVATALTLSASIFLIALPMAMVQTFLGIAVSITIGGLFLAATNKCRICLTEFKTFTRHKEQYASEINLLSFFQLPPEKNPETEAAFPEPEIAFK